MEDSLRVQTKKLKFTDSEDVCSGRRPCVSILSEKNIVVLLIDCSVWYNLYYFVGHLQADGETIDWDPGVPYTTGNRPTAALVSLGDSIFVIEAHNTHFEMIRKQSHYNLWRLNTSTRKMEGNFDGTLLSRGRKPRISANEEGWAIAVCEGVSEYYVGQLKVDQHENPQITWRRQYHNSIGKSPAVSICGKKVVLVYRDPFSIKTMVGELQEHSSEINWFVQVGQQTTLSGLSPSVSLNNKGMLVISYQSIVLRRVIVIPGSVNDHIITFNHKAKMRGETKGEYPAVFISNSQTVFLIYKKGFGTTLRLKTGFADQLQKPILDPPEEIPNAGH